MFVLIKGERDVVDVCPYQGGEGCSREGVHRTSSLPIYFEYVNLENYSNSYFDIHRK